MIATAVMNGPFLAATAVSGSLSSGKSCTGIYADMELLWILYSWERCYSWMDFLCWNLVVYKAWLISDVEFVCLHQRRRINCSLLYLHSIDTNSSESLFLKKNTAINILVIKKTIPTNKVIVKQSDAYAVQVPPLPPLLPPPLQSPPPPPHTPHPPKKLKREIKKHKNRDEFRDIFFVLFFPQETMRDCSQQRTDPRME